MEIYTLEHRRWWQPRYQAHVLVRHGLWRNAPAAFTRRGAQRKGARLA
jgi:hypothetical protein